MFDAAGLYLAKNVLNGEVAIQNAPMLRLSLMNQHCFCTLSTTGLHPFSTTNLNP